MKASGLILEYDCMHKIMGAKNKKFSLLLGDIISVVLNATVSNLFLNNYHCIVRYQKLEEQ